MNKALPFLLITLLVGAVCLQVFGEADKRTGMIAPDVANLLPKEIPGWTVSDHPIAESPDVQKAVDSILHYDSAVFRFYKKGDTEIAVYLAYWLPGKIDPALLDAHTPDICWVDNGWQDTILPALPVQAIHGVLVPVPNHRRFVASGEYLTVLFWQVDGHTIRHTVSIAEGKLSFLQKINRRIWRVWKGVTTPPGQQIFMRISSNHMIADELSTPPVHDCFLLLGQALHGENFYAYKN